MDDTCMHSDFGIVFSLNHFMIVGKANPKLLFLCQKTRYTSLQITSSKAAQYDTCVLIVESLLGSGTQTDGDTSEARRLSPTIIDIESDSRAMFPFGLMHADQYVAPRLALVSSCVPRLALVCTTVFTCQK